jgi:acetyl esterase/lipase
MARTTFVRVVALTAIGSGACTATALPAHALPLTPYQQALLVTAAAPAAAPDPGWGGWGGVQDVTGTSATTTTHTGAAPPAAAPKASSNPRLPGTLPPVVRVADSSSKPAEAAQTTAQITGHPGDPTGTSQPPGRPATRPEATSQASSAAHQPAPSTTPAVPSFTGATVAPPTLTFPPPPVTSAAPLAVVPQATPTAPPVVPVASPPTSSPVPAAVAPVPATTAASQAPGQAAAPAADVAVTITVTIAPQSGGTWSVASQQLTPAQPAASTPPAPPPAQPAATQPVVVPPAITQPSAGPSWAAQPAPVQPPSVTDPVAPPPLALPTTSPPDEQASPSGQSHSRKNRQGAPSGDATPIPASPPSPWFAPTAPQPSTPAPSGASSTSAALPDPSASGSSSGTGSAPGAWSPADGAPVDGQGTSAAGSSSASAFHGWSSGASGDDVATGSFGNWRGSAVTMAGTWDDGDAATQTDLPTVAGEFKTWDGDLDVAVGGTVLGSDESYAQAAQGAYLDRWTTMAKNLQTLRGDTAGTTYVRPFHEFNGDWYTNWQVTPANLTDYKAAFRLIAQTIRQNCPRCKIVWSPNNGTSSGSASPADAYPGDDVVDVIGVDSYNANGNTVVTDPQTWQQYADAASNGAPVGPEAWRQFAESHGKPIAFPEWGLNSGGGGGDDPAYIQGMHDWMTQHAAQPGDTDLAGKVVYDVYFNIAMGGNNGFLIKDGPNTQSAQTYTRLHWGTAIRSSGATTAAADTTTPREPQTQQPQSQPQQTPGQDLRVGPVGVTADAQTVKDLAYASASPAQALDLYLPKRTGTPVPLVIDIHGGAFNSGDKASTDVLFNLQPLLAKGYAVASLNYRLSGEAPFPAGVQDVKAAVRYLRAHAAEYGIDSTRFAAWGTSAGGYLAAMIGVTGGQTNAVLDDAALGNAGVTSTVQAVVSMYGPSDFTTIDNQLKQACGDNASRNSGGTSPESQWLGAPVSSSPNAQASSVPAWVASAGALPPFLLAHGDADCTVPVGQSTELADALQRAGTTVHLQVVPGAGHSDQAIDQGLLGSSIDFITRALTGTAPAALPLTSSSTTTTTPSATPTTPAATAPASTTPPDAQTTTSSDSAASQPPHVTSTGS